MSYRAGVDPLLDELWLRGFTYQVEEEGDLPGVETQPDWSGPASVSHAPGPLL